MADIKWIKLTVNVFDDEKFDAIKVLPDSNDIQLAWVKLLCLAGTINENGFLVLTREIPYTDDMLAKRFSMDIGVVQRAMKIFQTLDMVEVVDNVYMVSNWLKYQSGDRLEEIRRKDRERKAAQKQKQKEELLEQKEENDSTEIPRKFHGICSYSYSNNTNISNLNYIIDNNIYKNIDYLLSNISILNSIKEWMIYKDNKKPKNSNHYDTELGITKLLSQVISHAKEYGIKETIEIIDLSIANNWQGIAWSNLERQQKKKSFDREAWLKE